MKRILILISFLLIGIISFGQSENEIFTLVLNDYASKMHIKEGRSNTIILVLTKPKYQSKLDVNEYPRFYEKYKKLEKNTFENFILKQESKLDFDTIKLKDAIALLVENDSSLNPKKLLLTYPGWDHYYYELSNIGFNDKRTQAMVYYGFSGLSIGGGFYIIYEKKKNKWRELKTIPAWAS
jgi:hypothetical protein